MKTADFDYDLPPELIAQQPAARRDASRLMVLRREPSAGSRRPSAIGRRPSAISRQPSAISRPPSEGRVSPGLVRFPSDPLTHHVFSDLPSFVEAGDVVVVNDSRVIPARLLGSRAGGGTAEILLVSREEGGTWRALVRPGSRIRAGNVLHLDGEDRIEIVAHLPEGMRRVRLTGPGGEDAVLARRGRVPLPPYIERAPTDLDVERYQTVYADAPGSVAAPTAGLHFTPELLAAIEARGAVVARLTLHVGPGTFRRVTAMDPAAHHLEPEWYVVPAETARAVAAARACGGAVWAIGTTVTRTLESCAEPDGSLRTGFGWSSLFIRPGHTFRVVDHLVTNFHLPRSTLLMLVAAFAGTDVVLAAYCEAVAQRYRFYSYGDAMAIL